MRRLIPSNFWGLLFCAALLWLPSSSACFWECKPGIAEEVNPETDVEIEIRDPRIPDLAYRLKRIVRAEINYHWGMEQGSTVFNAQIHQESAWNPEAKSPYASGLAQFTPDTAAWISRLYPADLGGNNPLDARWAIRACIKYDHWLYDRASYADNDDHRWRFTLAGYNGGEGNIKKDRALAEANGRSPNKWTGHVEDFSNRAAWAFKENRGYVRKILDQWSPIYLKGGFL